MKTIHKSTKLANVLYDVRGPIVDAARQMEDEGQKIIKLNIGNLAPFGFEPPEEIVQDMIRNLPDSAGYSDSKGIFSARKAVMHYTQEQGIEGVTIDDIYLGNGASDLIGMATNALLSEGDEMLVPAPDYPLWTAVASLSGGKPVHYLCDEDNGWMPRLEDIRAKITPRTKAIIPVHAFGQPADMDPILEIAARYNLAVIEDACEAIGAEYKGRQAGTLGEAAIFAFYPNKQMTTGEGGMIITDNEDWANLFRSLRNQGRDVFDAWLNHTRLGYNYRMDELSAALGLAQIGRIEELLAKREQVATWYNERIDKIPGIQKPFISDTTTRMSWFVYVIRCEDDVSRNRLMKYLEQEGVPSRPYFTPIHLQPFYQREFGWKRGDLPNTEKAGDNFLALPFSGVMTEEQVDYVAHKLREGIEAAQ